jgi:hypothetical protein
MKDLVSQLSFDDAFPNALIYSFRHLRIICEAVPGFCCVNIGSDYSILMHYLLEE